MQLELSVEEINTILTVMGDMPIKTGFHPLVMKIKQQAEDQLRQPPPLPDED